MKQAVGLREVQRQRLAPVTVGARRCQDSPARVGQERNRGRIGRGRPVGEGAADRDAAGAVDVGERGPPRRRALGDERRRRGVLRDGAGIAVPGVRRGVERHAPHLERRLVGRQGLELGGGEGARAVGEHQVAAREDDGVVLAVRPGRELRRAQRRRRAGDEHVERRPEIAQLLLDGRQLRVAAVSRDHQHAGVDDGAGGQRCRNDQRRGVRRTSASTATAPPA